ncbi:PTS system transporter subunit IIA [Streptococcus pneumoniae]|nr:PTS system transporter subunit IIA [Streptococcus pneumoniae]
MVLDYFFDKNLVFCLEADNQEQLFDQVLKSCFSGKSTKLDSP